jgi:membrane-associated protease RseP (regulator of RpoE activity)
VIAGVVGFVLILAVVIMIHEAGHFVLARRFGMKVEQFFLGFGPRIWSTTRGETEYGVKAILLGGYVRIAGMNPFVEPKEEDLPRTYGAKPVWQRTLVILAGPVTHFLMAFVALWTYFTFIGEPRAVTPLVTAVAPTLGGTTSPAAAAGVRPGDEVIAVDGRVMGLNSFVSYTRSHEGVPVEVTLVGREGRRVVTMTPVESVIGGERAPRFGVTLAPGSVLTRTDRGPIDALALAGEELSGQAVLVLRGLGDAFGPEGIVRRYESLFGDRPRSPTDVVSVAGVARAAGGLVSRGYFDQLLFMFVQLNIVVGLLNLLPLPPLDGGHLAVLLVEKVRRRPIDARKLIPVSAAVLVLLVVLMLPVLLLDFFEPLPLGM